jgi:hypothetical protein
VAVWRGTKLQIQKAESTPRSLRGLGHAGFSLILAECGEGFP